MRDIRRKKGWKDFCIYHSLSSTIAVELFFCLTFTFCTSAFSFASLPPQFWDRDQKVWWACFDWVPLFLRVEEWQKTRIGSKKEGSTIKAYLIKYTNQLYIKSTCLLNFSWRFWTLIVSLDSIALTSWKLIVFGNLWKSRHWW